MVLRAVVIGTGWSGEGHARAMQAAGIEVSALCGRTPEPARNLAIKVGVQEVRFHRRQALLEFRPEMVAISTPGIVHAEIAIFAAAQGCHIICEKPLGMNAAEARAMLYAVEQAGVKHAVGATSRYLPATVYAQSLLAQGVIGKVREIEAIHHFNTSPLLPYSWFHQLGQGGGALYVDFSHFLSQVLFITGGNFQLVKGEGRCLIERAPLGAPVHDLRQGLVPMDADQASTATWQDVDADMGYTVMARLRMPEGNIASVLFQGSETGTGRYPNALTNYGDKGVLHLPGYFFPEVVELYDRRQQAWSEMSIPEEISRAFTITEDPVQNAWTRLYQEFVLDVHGAPHQGYPTFREGWIANVIIDIARNGTGWAPVPQYPE